MASKNYIIRGANSFNVSSSQSTLQARKVAAARAAAEKQKREKQKQEEVKPLKEGELRNLPNDPSGRTKEYMSVDDSCPICHTNRFLNPKLRLLVSNKCFHKMCESCISRLYTLGPESCPTNGCNLILRKTNFTPQTFEDLKVEREVDTRKRIAKTFNKRQQDFSTLKEYNDYLELVEEITFNLIHNISVKETEKKIQKFQHENSRIIAENFLEEEREREAEMKREEEELLARQERQRLAEEEAEEEEREKAEARKTVLKELVRKRQTNLQRRYCRSRVLRCSRNLPREVQPVLPYPPHLNSHTFSPLPTSTSNPLLYPCRLQRIRSRTRNARTGILTMTFSRSPSRMQASSIRGLIISLQIERRLLVAMR
ncbi:CDK-activating kinase assembly factor [Atractiella rhizophila]|nr:CDK-activating kinase assembly factor [Atractiella rhizophila]